MTLAQKPGVKADVRTSSAPYSTMTWHDDALKAITTHRKTKKTGPPTESNAKASEKMGVADKEESSKRESEVGLNHGTVGQAEKPDESTDPQNSQENDGVGQLEVTDDPLAESEAVPVASADKATETEPSETYIDSFAQISLDLSTAIRNSDGANPEPSPLRKSRHRKTRPWTAPVKFVTGAEIKSVPRSQHYQYRGRTISAPPGISRKSEPEGHGVFGKSPHRRCCYLPTSHSIDTHNTFSLTCGPHVDLLSLLGPPPSPRPSARPPEILHLSAWYHVPGRYGTVVKPYPPKRLQKRPNQVQWQRGNPRQSEENVLVEAL